MQELVSLAAAVVDKRLIFQPFQQIAPRSGLAVKNFIDVGAGVVDYDYRGNVGVVLFNHRSVNYPLLKSKSLIASNSIVKMISRSREVTASLN